MSNDDKCPCVDGLPDPCTLCGAPADGVCEIDTLVGWKHRALRAEAEARRLREQAQAIMQARAAHHPFVDSTAWALIESLAVAEGAEERGQTTHTQNQENEHG